MSIDIPVNYSMISPKLHYPVNSKSTTEDTPEQSVKRRGIPVDQRACALQPLAISRAALAWPDARRSDSQHLPYKGIAWTF